MNKNGELCGGVNTFNDDTKGLTLEDKRKMETPRSQHKEKERFNKLVNDDVVERKKIAPYMWIYRWEEPTELDIKSDKEIILPAEKILNLNEKKDQHRYLRNILENRTYIVIYHKAGPSKLKQCIDVDHFHMITWHHNHPTSEHSFMGLKKAMANRGLHPYSVTCSKVYNPYGLAEYFKKEPEKQDVIAVNRINTEGQKAFLQKITVKKISEKNTRGTKLYRHEQQARYSTWPEIRLHCESHEKVQQHRRGRYDIL